MEDIEKYVFDPKNPKEFKIYGLLRTLAQKDDSVIFSDPNFSTILFPDIIFDNETTNQIWEKPKDFDKLAPLSKINLYIKSYTEFEFNNLVFNKLSPFFNTYFSAFNGLLPFGDYSMYFSVLENGFDSSLFEKSNNIICFITKKFFYLLPKKTSVSWIVFVLENEFEALKEQKFSKNIRPIILKEIKHLFILFDVLKRDAVGEGRINLQNKFSNNYLLKSKIENYFSLGKVNFKFKNQNENYFIGENGDGKTLLLQAILLGLVGNQKIGAISDFIKQNKNNKKLRLEATDNEGNLFQFSELLNIEKNYANQIFAYGINRFQNDSDKKDPHGFLTLFSHDEYLENPVKWLQHLDYQEKSGTKPDIPLSKAKALLNDLLEKNVSIEVSPDGVDFYERGTKLKFEQLSDGYKSVLVWMCDLLSRLATKQPDIEHISDFHGIVLVDEIGMFLHPKWQRTIVKKLRTTFPNIQFFFTTHSPIVLLGASEDAVFYKVYKEEGETKVSNPIENKSLGHLMANGILTAPFLFGLESAHSESYNPETDNLDTSDDYLTGKIHEAVSKKIAEDNNIPEDKIMDLIQQELDKYQAQETND